ncbi:hypothetical protein FB45DRAFT_470110 [Roridomyces roridus]|uniref:RRM domain-containing protein n=1 Tax=Roridomyces roridus TaxID=1738132 RepID=A0AAD7BYX3_9AGAR|nr:hypothetical protein FB45DRAFT_470110 [Roridomyces roridus]
MTHTPSLSGPIFKFSRETNSVRVENIPQNVNRLEVLSLFSTLIGDIRTSQDSDDALEITFFTGDSARKALCMNGYNIIRSASPVASHGAQQGRRADARRNLYVLGVPFGMTNQSLAETFTPYGIVSHCVILATLDGASRRRGFVVMSSHEEARQAMAALGRNGKGGGGGMDISWAVVQRSKGFLDGGDRAGVVQPPTAATLNSAPPVVSSQIPTSNPSLPTMSMVPTTTLLLANLPLLLFGSEDDLRGLVCPFGTVNVLRIVTLPTRSASSKPFLPGSASTPAPSTTAAIVEYDALAAAQEAHRALDGESYAGCTVRVVYLVEADAGPGSAPESPLPETPTFSPQLSFPASLLPSSRCAPAVSMPQIVFDDQSDYYGHSARQWQGAPAYMQRQPQFYPSPSFPPINTYPVYGNSMFSGRWIPDTMYARAPLSRDVGFYV